MDLRRLAGKLIRNEWKPDIAVAFHNIASIVKLNVLSDLECEKQGPSPNTPNLTISF